MTYYPLTLDVHRGDPSWDYDETENPYPGSSHLAYSALVRSLPAPRVAVGEKEEAR